MKRTIVVTGGSGFVGANVVRKLIKEEYNVHIIVRNSTSAWRLHEVLKKITVHEGTLGKPLALRKLMQKIRPYAVFHLAAYGSYPKQKDVQTMIDVNITGTRILLESLRDISYTQLILAGSSSEYGKKEKVMKETDVLEPNNFYAAAKAAQTHLGVVFAKTYKKPLIVLRLFNVYGYYEEKGRLVRSVIESVLSKRPVLLASGKEARDFIFTEDVADAFLQAAKHSEFCGEIFNVGTGVQTTIYKLAVLVRRIAPANVSIKRYEYEGRPWDTYHWKADTKKTEKLLGWSYSHSLSEGLKKTIDWYNKNQ